MNRIHCGLARSPLALLLALGVAGMLWGCGTDSDEGLADRTRREPPKPQRVRPPEPAEEIAEATVPRPEPAETEEVTVAASAVDEDTVLPAESPHEAFREAETLFLAGDWESAVDKLRASILARADFAPAHYLLGLCYRKAGRLEDAERSLRDAIRLDPGHQRAHINLGRVLVDREKPEAALEALATAAENDSLSDQLWNVRGLALLDLGQIAEAETAFARASELNPTNVYALNNLGLSRIRLGDFDQAVSPLQVAAELADAPAYVFNNFGIALERTGELDRAAEAFRKAALVGHPNAGNSLERVEQLLAARAPEASEKPEETGAVEPTPLVAERAEIQVPPDPTETAGN